MSHPGGPTKNTVFLVVCGMVKAKSPLFFVHLWKAAWGGFDSKLMMLIAGLTLFYIVATTSGTLHSAYIFVMLQSVKSRTVKIFTLHWFGDLTC